MATESFCSGYTIAGVDDGIGTAEIQPSTFLKFVWIRVLLDLNILPQYSRSKDADNSGNKELTL